MGPLAHTPTRRSTDAACTTRQAPPLTPHGTPRPHPDTAEYGCYLYDQACRPLLTEFMAKQNIDVIGTKFNKGDNGVDNVTLNAVNEAIRSHPVEVIGKELRGYMTDMEKIA